MDTKNIHNNSVSSDITSGAETNLLQSLKQLNSVPMSPMNNIK